MSTVFDRSPSTEPRFLALALPKLSTDRVRRERLGRGWRTAALPEPGAARRPWREAPLAEAPAPLALHAREANAERLVALCEAAEAAGLAPGLGLAEARARLPGLDVLEADPGADARLLAGLADWCERYTPLVALDPPHGLVLDISGCAHLLGGEKALLSDLLARLFHGGFAARGAIASHPGTAAALAACRTETHVPPGGEAEAVAPLSVRVLRLDPVLAGTLERLGLKTLGALLDQPRAGLARRYGQDLLDRLDRAIGRARRPIDPRRPASPLLAERRFAQAIGRASDVEAVVLHLAGRLRRDMERQGLGGRRFALALFRADGHVERLSVGASVPQRDETRVLALFRERIAGLADPLDPGFGYDMIRLEVPVAEPLAERQSGLGAEGSERGDLAGLVDRLGARLGERRVLVLRGEASHRPERAQRLLPLAAAGKGGAPAAPQLLRPARLLDPPERVEAIAEIPDGPPMRFRWRRVPHAVRRSEGPERIGAEWWREDAAETRDYWRVEDEDGRRFWMFRALKDGAPNLWYLHGLFA